MDSVTLENLSALLFLILSILLVVVVIKICKDKANYVLFFIWVVALLLMIISKNLIFMDIYSIFIFGWIINLIRTAINKHKASKEEQIKLLKEQNELLRKNLEQKNKEL